MISNKSLKKVQWLDATLLLFLLMSFQMLIYGSIIMTLHSHFILCVKFIFLILSYGYCYWIIKHCSDILFFAFRKISKRNDLMKNPKATTELSLPLGSASDLCTVTVHPLIPCDYLETFIFDGRSGHLNKYNCTPVLDGRDGKSKTINNKMIYHLWTNVFSSIASFVETFGLFGNILYSLIFTYTLACTSLDTEYDDHFNQADPSKNISDDMEPLDLNEIILVREFLTIICCLNLFVIKEKVYNLSYSLFMHYSFHLCFMIYESIINSEHKLAKIMFHGVRPLYVVDNANSKSKGRPQKKKLLTSNQRN